MRNILLAPISWLYGWIISVRNHMYDTGARRSQKYRVPVICVGNVTVGGTGKTPVCEMLIEHFSAEYNVALLSRGYGRTTKGYREVSEKSSYRHVGDEPKQIKSKFPGILVVVCENRREGIERITAEHPETNLIIMDDGFQHRAVEPKLNVLTVDFTRPVDKDRMLPLGTLRDNPKQIRRAHYVIVTKCPPNITALDRRIERKRLNLLPFQCLFFTGQEAGPIVPAFPGPDGQAHTRAGQSVIAMAGIGNPDTFVEGLAAKYDVVDTIIFRDHHPYRVRDLRRMEDTLAKAPPETIIVTTEKDAIKLGSGNKIPPGLRSRIYVQPIRTTFAEDYKKDFFEKLEYDVRTDQEDCFFYPR